jgi:Rieske 2Fe-2S family protein
MDAESSTPPLTASNAAEALQPTLPGAAYADPERFTREQAAIFERGWCAALRVDELAGAGAFASVSVGRESVLVWRDGDGDIRAALNVCRHRGSRLCADVTGTVGRGFRCPYHAWTYGLDGRLVAAPQLASFAGGDREELRLVPVHVEKWLGYVWLCVAVDAEPFEQTVVADVVARLGDAAAIDRYDIDRLRLGRRHTYDVAANWKLIVENFMECYHCPTIHPELVRVLPEFARGYAAQYYVGHGTGFADDAAGFTIDGRPGLERIESINDLQDRRYFAITIRPNVFVNLLPDHVVLHRLTPLAPDRTQIVCDWLYLPAVIERGDDLDASVELFDRVNRQDFAACERCQLATTSRAYAAGGVLVPAEHHIGAFHRWVDDRLG